MAESKVNISKVSVTKPTEEQEKTAKKWPIWTKEVSKFDWEYTDKEACLILEGDVEISDLQGGKVSFKAGDYVVFPQGLKCVWNVKKDVKKHYKFG